MKTFKTIASLLVGTVSSLLLMGCGEIDTGTGERDCYNCAGRT